MDNKLKKMIIITICFAVSVVSIAMQIKGCVNNSNDSTEAISSEADIKSDDSTEAISSEKILQHDKSSGNEITKPAMEDEANTQQQQEFEDKLFNEEVEEEDNYYLYFTNTVDEIDVPGFLPKEAHMKLISSTQQYIEEQGLVGITELSVVKGSCQSRNDKAVFVCYSPQTSVAVTVTYHYGTGKYSYSHSMDKGGE